MTKEVAREARAMLRRDVIVKAIEGKLTWTQASQVLGVTARHMRRLKERYETDGYDGLWDMRGRRPRRRRIPLETIREVCRLKEGEYADWSVAHFHERLVEEHGIAISETWTRLVLQAAGLVEKAPARGKHRRRRERRPVVGMMVHLDASTHEWIAGLPRWDLVWAMDDADGRALHGRFVPQEGTLSTMAALREVVGRYGRFAELYHDRASHFGRTSRAGEDPDEVQEGQVTRALRVLGIRQIFAKSPQARGRSERAFGTIQGRLPQELAHAGVRDYEAANRYLEEAFLPDFNRRFTVEPSEPGSAWVPMKGIDLDLVFSARHERVVRGDNTMTFRAMTLQIPPSKSRPHFVRCPVVVHEFPDGTLGVSYRERLLGRYEANGTLKEPTPTPRPWGAWTTKKPLPTRPTASKKKGFPGLGGTVEPKPQADIFDCL
jgi:transposase